METLGNLRELVMGQIMAFVSRNIVEAAIVKLVSMLNPAGAFIQAIIAIYNTIMFFVERLQQIAQVAMAVIDSISAIAAGAIGAAANKVESTLAGLLTLAISFLARLMGLGRVSDAIRNVVERVRAPINAAIDRVIGWIVGLARRVVGAVKSGVQSVLNWAGIRKPLKVDNEAHNLYIEGEGAQRRVMMASDPAEYKKTLEKVKIKDTDPKAKDKEKAKAGALATLDKLQDTMAKAAKGGPDGAKAAEGIDALMGQLALLTPQFMSKSGAGKSTPPIYGGTGPGGFGVTVGVEKLTEDHEAGSGPSASSGEWEALASRKDGGSTYYVRGHLLNDNLGGTGAEWQNLAPLTQATNNRSAVSMLRTFENTVKDAVLKDKKTVNLTVTMSYGQPGRQANADKVKKSWTPKADADQIAKIIAAEAHVPSSVNCVAHEVADDGSRKALVQSSVANVIDTHLDHYSLGGVARKPMNINVVSKAQLMTLAGVTDAVADTIIKERKKSHFADRDDALTRLGASVWHAMVSTAGVSIRCE